MPAKGKHHHLSHHHHHHQSQQQQQHQQHPQHQQHLVNVHQSGGAGGSQTYNTVIATTRGYVSHAGILCIVVSFNQTAFRDFRLGLWLLEPRGEFLSYLHGVKVLP
ncbi:hypothetical protein PV327_004772 [Microctonus hyperodae]|uniref:Uncharacterized protein n=1 Tax=Microctonus hyperodae TaxID=165561 RepID=A0AA39KMW8_MICHY|nr:hypothetical protein PV327_004772 [Microctonus hyperodae]